MANDIENSLYWERDTGTFIRRHIVNDGEDPPNFYYVNGSRLASDITTTSTSIVLDDGTWFSPGGGTCEIDGDVITYGGKSTHTLTSCTNISESHSAGAAVHVWASITAASDLDGRAGIYYASLADELFVQGISGAAVYDGSSMTNIVDGNEVDALFATTYRDRVFCCRIVFQNRVYYTAAGDSTTWEATNYFTVEGSRGEPNIGLRVSASDELLIFKTNSFFAYNEVNLKERSSVVGAYNHRVIQEKNNLFYTTCPAGVFVTNGLSVKKISDPVKDYLKGFLPIYDTQKDRVVRNIFATIHDNKYIIYLGNITYPETLLGVALVYDIDKGSWSVWDGLEDLKHLKSLPSSMIGGQIQKNEILFAGDNAGKYYRFFSDEYVDADDNIRLTGSKIYKDLISNAVGFLISSRCETKYYDVKTPGWIKEFGYLRVVAESAGFTLAYKIEGRKGETSWKPLGTTEKVNQRFAIPKEDTGYRIKFRITHDSIVSNPTLNALILEDTNTISRD